MPPETIRAREDILLLSGTRFFITLLIKGIVKHGDY
jgi:hypothetical protein